MDRNRVVLAMSLLKKGHVQACLKFENKHLDDSEKGRKKMLWSGETKIVLLGINSTRCVLRGKKVTWTPRKPFQPLSMVMETLCFGAVSLLMGLDDYTGSRERWMRPSTGKSCVKISMPLPGHWIWIVYGCSSMIITQTIRLRKQRSGCRRSTLR